MTKGQFRVTWKWPRGPPDAELVDLIAIEGVHDANAALGALQKTPEWQQKRIVRVESIGEAP